MTTTERAFGKSVQRLEDPRLITGKGRFTDNLSRPGMAHMVVVRSPYAHARVKSVDSSAASAMPGVLGVFTGSEMANAGFGGIPCAWVVPDSDTKTPEHPPIAIDTVRYVGDAVAIVLAESEAQARDAMYAVEVDYEVLDVVINARAATRARIFVVAGCPAVVCLLLIIDQTSRSGPGSQTDEERHRVPPVQLTWSQTTATRWPAHPGVGMSPPP